MRNVLKDPSGKALFAKHNQLNNLVAIIDKNNIGASDYIENFTSLTSLKEKWISFGWNVIIVDGHNIRDLIKSFKKLKIQKIQLLLLLTPLKAKVSNLCKMILSGTLKNLRI